MQGGARDICTIPKGRGMGDEKMRECDLVIVGGGPAGLAAAEAAKKKGIDDILVLERDDRLGGILNQCIHNGFGLHAFGEELTGPEYAWRYIVRVKELGIRCLTGAMVLNITPGRQVTYISRQEGLVTVQAGAVILAMGCRERPRGALNIPGFRPMGIYSAGTAQRLVNVDGYLPGREVVILGSGDIGLIMARRMTLEGARVRVVAELAPYSGGLKRNIVQCLDDFGIPLKLRHTVIDIHGKKKLEGVTLAKVDEQNRPIPGTQEEYSCDTLLLSCGLIPENELSREMGAAINPITNGAYVDESLESSVPGVFACGNVLHVHDLVDYVSEEAAWAGESAARYLQGDLSAKGDRKVPIEAAGGIRYAVPSFVDPDRMGEKMKVRFRVGNVYKNCSIRVCLDDQCILNRKKQMATPGEMETIVLERAKLKEKPGLKKISLVLE